MSRTYWHVIGDDVHAGMMLNNTRLRKGMLWTGEIMRQILGPLQSKHMIISPYATFNTQPQKEKIWEDIRLSEYPNLPSRREALFLFETKDDLERASQKWWPGRPRRCLQAVVQQGFVHKADACLLDCFEPEWPDKARAYWSGGRTADPLFEVVVQGAIYFPEWETFPMLFPPPQP